MDEDEVKNEQEENELEEETIECIDDVVYITEELFNNLLSKVNDTSDKLKEMVEAVKANSELCKSIQEEIDAFVEMGAVVRENTDDSESDDTVDADDGFVAIEDMDFTV